LTQSSMKGLTYTRSDRSLFYRIIPYVHGPLVFPTNRLLATEELLDFASPHVKVYRNPADPSWDTFPAQVNKRGKCSYAFNMIPLDGSISLVASLPDGSSQSIALGDKYFANHDLSASGQSKNIYTYLFDPTDGEIYGDRRATFADRGWHDVTPITDPATRTTRPSVPGKTFQVRPKLDEVDTHILQTPFRAGLTVGLFDGSVRTLSPSINESVFWSLVTPNGGEVVGDF